VYSRVCGYHRPVANWNIGKAQEFKDRKVYKMPLTNQETSVQYTKEANNGD
jgi:ribonucleoside-triphosphate reductase